MKRFKHVKRPSTAVCNAARQDLAAGYKPGKMQSTGKERKYKKMENQEELSKVFCDAIKTLSEKPENLENLESYLSYHFETWMKKICLWSGKFSLWTKNVCRNGDITGNLPVFLVAAGGGSYKSMILQPAAVNHCEAF